MELASPQSPSTRPADEITGGMGVIDTIQMRDSLGASHIPGVVAILESFLPTEPQALVGRQVRIRTASGRVFSERVRGVREHGTTISLFFEGLTKVDIPIGSHIEFDD